jgi:hypothetical protein
MKNYFNNKLRLKNKINKKIKTVYLILMKVKKIEESMLNLSFIREILKIQEIILMHSIYNNRYLLHQFSCLYCKFSNNKKCILTNNSN